MSANLLADAGWDVVVLEAAPAPGGGVSSADYLGPGFVADVCSACYPLAAASPVIRELDLESYGLPWRHAPAVVAHPLPDGRAAVLHRDIEATVDGLEGLAPGDGQAWNRLWGLWDRVGDALLESLLRLIAVPLSTDRRPRSEASGSLPATTGPECRPAAKS